MKQPLHSFANRLTRRILLLWILMMSAIAAIVFFKAESGMTGLSDAHYNDVLDLTDEKVQGILRSVEISAVNIREGVERDLSSPDAVYASLERELGLNAHLKGCAIAFVSDYFPTEGHWFEPSVSRTKEGSMERRQLSVPEQNYSSSPLFNLTLTTGTDVWLDPHLDRNGDRMMREIDRIVHERDRIPDDAGHQPYSFLLDRDGDYLAHPDAERRLEKSFF